MEKVFRRDFFPNHPFFRCVFPHFALEKLGSKFRSRECVTFITRCDKVGATGLIGNNQRVVGGTSYRDSLDHFGDAGAAHGAIGEPACAIPAAAVMPAGDERARHLVVEANL